MNENQLFHLHIAEYQVTVAQDEYYIDCMKETINTYIEEY